LTRECLISLNPVGPTGKPNMTEAEWLSSRRLKGILWWVKRGVCERQLRLFACACCAAVEDAITPAKIRETITIAERYADGLASEEERTIAWQWTSDLVGEAVELMGEVAGGWGYALQNQAQATATAVVALAPPGQVVQTLEYFHWVWHQSPPVWCDLLRDIVGNPFNPRPADLISAFRKDGTINAIAQSIYEERRFADLPILADAMEDAGCTEPAILDHLRKPGVHVRGCWLVDRLLAKDDRH
jgi:hypothetical protein